METENKVHPRQQVWVCSELYWPEETSSGHFLTGIAEGLASTGCFTVGAICTLPTYEGRKSKVLKREIRNEVEIRRAWTVRFDKNKLAGRLLNIVVQSITMTASAFFAVRSGDMVISVTNPPVLPYLMCVVAKMRGAKFILLVHDLYPEVLVATGLLRENSRVARLIGAAAKWLYRSSARVVVLGRDMIEIVQAQEPKSRQSITMIPNWADLDELERVPPHRNPVLKGNGAADRFVVQFSGNIGRTHDVEVVARAAKLLKKHQNIHIHVIGGGGGLAELRALAEKWDLANVTFLPRQPRERLAATLSACDISIIPFRRGMFGISVPSRLYNLMLCGAPVIAVADADSELALTLTENKCGWQVPSGDAEQLAALIAYLAENPEEVRSARKVGIKAAHEKYGRELQIARWAKMLSGLDPCSGVDVASSCQNDP